MDTSLTLDMLLRTFERYNTNLEPWNWLRPEADPAAGKCISVSYAAATGLAWYPSSV